MSDYNRYKESAKKIKNQEKANRHINFVVVAYVGILLYLLILMYLSFTKDRVNFVYAEPGVIHDNSTFKGLILKDESVELAKDSGPVRYLVPEGSKVRQNTFVCTINQDPSIDELINKRNDEHLTTISQVTSLTLDDYRILQDKIREYAIDKHFNDGSLVYEAKSALKETIIDISQTVYVEDQELYDRIQAQIAANEDERYANGTYQRIPVSGVVGYTFDGFESYNIDNFSYDLLGKDIVINDNAELETIQEGNPIYKIVDNHKFYIVAEIDPYADKYLKKKMAAKDPAFNSLYFPKQNVNVEAKIYDVDFENDKYYAIFEIDRYFDDFFTDRFVDFIIAYDDYEGIKVPNEAVTSLDMIMVPTTGINITQEGHTIVTKLVYSDDDITHTEPLPVIVKVYYKDNEWAYVRPMNDINNLVKGDQILYYTADEEAAYDVNESFTIGATLPMEGVYVINNGYTDFKRISTIHEEDDFRIVADRVSYSIRIYDKLASDARQVVEFQTIN